MADNHNVDLSQPRESYQSTAGSDQRARQFSELSMAASLASIHKAQLQHITLDLKPLSEVTRPRQVELWFNQFRRKASLAGVEEDEQLRRLLERYIDDELITDPEALRNAQNFNEVTDVLWEQWFARKVGAISNLLILIDGQQAPSVKEAIKHFNMNMGVVHASMGRRVRILGDETAGSFLEQPITKELIRYSLLRTFPLPVRHELERLELTHVPLARLQTAAAAAETRLAQSGVLEVAAVGVKEKSSPNTKGDLPKGLCLRCEKSFPSPHACWVLEKKITCELCGKVGHLRIVCSQNPQSILNKRRHVETTTPAAAAIVADAAASQTDDETAVFKYFRNFDGKSN